MRGKVKNQFFPFIFDSPDTKHDREEFISYHKNNHALLFSSIPEVEMYVKKYVVSHPIEMNGFPHPMYDE